MSLAGVKADRLVDVGRRWAGDDRHRSDQLVVDAQLNDRTAPQAGDIDDGKIDIVQTGLLVGMLNHPPHSGRAVTKDPLIPCYFVKGNGAGGIKTNDLADTNR